MSLLYEKEINMCKSKKIAKGILKKSVLGKKLVDGGMISYDFYDSTIDGEPNQVIVTINNYPVSTFWYKFFNQSSFTLNKIEKEAEITFTSKNTKDDFYVNSINNKIQFRSRYCNRL